VLTRRIVACLDVRDGRVVKGVRFGDHVDAGDIEALAMRYRDERADELVFYDITASPQGRSVDLGWVTRVSRCLDIPFCVAGGIRSVEDARRVLNAGADKVSVNSPALERPALIDELAREFGVQCVVVGVDSRAVGGVPRVHQYTGDASRTRATPRETVSWVREARSRGAGEIVLNCMDTDGARTGYDLAQLRAVREACDVPLVASGGAGAPGHFEAVFAPDVDADAALAASVFHSGTIRIPALKAWLRARSVEVRP
jgi:imidazole glycerol-phosphate synthase subunit HisF